MVGLAVPAGTGRPAVTRTGRFGAISLGYVYFRRENLDMAADITGIANRQSELIGLGAEAMDPVETRD